MFCGGVMITVFEAKEMLKAIDDLAIFQANHLGGNVPVILELVKLSDLLKRIIISNKNNHPHLRVLYIF